MDRCGCHENVLMNTSSYRLKYTLSTSFSHFIRGNARHDQIPQGLIEVYGLVDTQDDHRRVRLRARSLVYACACARPLQTRSKPYASRYATRMTAQQHR